MQREQAQSTPSLMRRGALGILLFWLAALALLYLGFSHYESRQQAKLAPYARNPGELVIPRSPDGHFRLPGTVNGLPVQFLVDTGASLVTVSETFARQAGLNGGAPVTFRTANGTLQGRVLGGIAVTAATMALPAATVAVGLEGDDPRQALLGQSFLSKFDLSLTQREMVLRSRAM